MARCAPAVFCLAAGSLSPWTVNQVAGVQGFRFSSRYEENAWKSRISRGCLASGVVASTQVLNTGPEPIWALMCEAHRYREITDPTERMIDVPGREFCDGYVYKEHGCITAFIGEAEWRVTECKPKRHRYRASRRWNSLDAGP